MKICVIGAGVVGLSTAYALARLGHNVTILDRNNNVAGGASHANGAQLSFSYVDPFAGPASLRALPRYLLGFDPAIRLLPSMRPSYWLWGLKFLRNCTSTRELQNFQSRAALAAKSAQAFDDIVQSLPAGALAKTSQGKLVLLQDSSAYQAAIENRAKYTGLGLERDVLDREAALQREPALRSFAGRSSGGIFAKSDFALDPVVYCEALARQLVELGAALELGEPVSGLITSGDQVIGIRTSQRSMNFDKVIMCAGNFANDLLNPLGLSVPIYPMQGYSLTLPTTSNSPKVSITSVNDKIVFANLGTSMRIAGFMDANQSAAGSQKRQRQLWARAQSLWPDIAEYGGDVKYWTGQRPMTPSGVPVIGETRLKGLYLNAGHGSLGYTFAAGSAMVVAGKIGGDQYEFTSISGGQRYAVS